MGDIPCHTGTLTTPITKIAKQQNLPRLWLDSRDTAKTFYQQGGFTLHTSIPCWIEADKLA